MAIRVNTGSFLLAGYAEGGESYAEAREIISFVHIGAYFPSDGMLF